MKVSKVLKRNIAFDHKVNKLTINSKNVELNDIFFAIKGSKTDGNLYIEEAIRKGAKTVVTEDSNVLYNNINVVVVKDLNKYLGECCRRYYKDISKNVKLVGITGTNGKTTTATLVYKYFRFINQNVSLISTNGIYINDKYYENENTTPNIIKIYEVIKESINEGCNYVIMEVSSHAIKLNRVNGLSFEIGCLTNITHDHLDFHKTFEDYKFSKLLFLTKAKFPIINILYSEYIPYLNNNCITFGEREKTKKCNYEINNVIENLDGIEFDLIINNVPRYIKSNMLARFNALNITLFIAIIKTLKVYDKKIVDEFLISDINVPGRLEIVNKNPKIIIDFAHTPDAVYKILKYFNSHKDNGRLVTVIGMGGNRDKDKRKEVGKIATSLSDIVIFTEDNSRNEKVQEIINDILSEIKNDKMVTNYIVEYNRLEAIKQAISIANENDLICILGRGAEEYLEIDNILIPFSDKNVVLKLIYKLYQ